MKITCTNKKFFARQLDKEFKANTDAAIKNGINLQNPEGLVLKDEKIYITIMGIAASVLR